MFTRFDRGDPAITAQPDDEIIVRLAGPFDASRVAERHFVATASCGICGKAIHRRDRGALRARCPAGPVVPPEVLLALPGRLREAQAVFEVTGGLHAAGVFDADGGLIAVREDIGRHNALDKLIGSRLRAGELPAPRPDRPGLGSRWASSWSRRPRSRAFPCSPRSPPPAISPWRRRSAWA